MTGNGNIARLRSGASVERRKFVTSTVAQASRRSVRFLLLINRFAYFACFAVPIHENYQTNPNANFDFTQQIRPDALCLDTCRIEKRTQAREPAADAEELPAATGGKLR